MANAGTQHNVIPDRCTFVVDIRSNECYTNQELFDEIRKHISCEAKARSFRLGSSRFAGPPAGAEGRCFGTGALRLSHTVRPGTDAVPVHENGTGQKAVVHILRTNLSL